MLLWQISFPDTRWELSRWYQAVIFNERFQLWVCIITSTHHGRNQPGTLRMDCKAVEISSSFLLPLNFPGSATDGQNQCISWRSRKTDDFQREFQPSGRVEWGEGDGEQSGEGGAPGETLLTKRRETGERIGKLQKYIERLCTFLPFKWLCSNTLPLWWRHSLPR